ncbi:MAG TPA: acyl-CoA reductase, partial [Maribacter sp.]|nr:acyl-CoA reductase [Maribacter sp.]
RYFEYYFGKKPNIIRKNRNSVAVLSGKESQEELTALGEDIFRYFGLGCRSVSKIYLPKEYNIDTFFKAMFPYNSIINHHKYANNYDYNKAVYLMSEFKLLDNGFLILKEEESFGSPIASLFYEYYEDVSTLKEKLKDNKENLQCIVSSGFVEDEISFGNTQKPMLNDYADGIDTIAFLLNTSKN